MQIELGAFGATGDEIAARISLDGKRAFVYGRGRSELQSFLYPTPAQARQIVETLSAWLADGAAEQQNENKEA